jgi:hypothetical protein
MVEVFKTNVQDKQQAMLLLQIIHDVGVNYKATFDLGDCDKILRVECNQRSVNTPLIINILLEYGYVAEVLQDEILTST